VDRVLTIRKEQIDALGMEKCRDFEERLIQHVTRFFSGSPFLREAGARREFIRLGCQRAAGYGFRSEREVCKYINLMCVLGPDFDTDRGNTWAAEILTRSGLDSKARIQRLVRAAAEHCRVQTRPLFKTTE
jgi:hypothetical protein